MNQDKRRDSWGIAPLTGVANRIRCKNMGMRILSPKELTSLRSKLKVELAANSKRSIPSLARALDTPEVDIQMVLLGNTDMFRAVGNPPKWQLHSAHSKKQANTRATKEATARAATPASEPAKQRIAKKDRTQNWSSLAIKAPLPSMASLKLRKWQKEALTSWIANDRHGIISAVTGAGKTRVGIAAIRDQLGRRGKVVVLVPNQILQDQWFQEIKETFPSRTVVRLGNGHKQTLANGEILVAIAASGRQYSFDVPKGSNCLLIADECHRYASSKNRKALEDACNTRLGLTATVERMDGLHETVLYGYFGPIVYSLGYEQALREKVISPFRTCFVGSNFTPDERKLYDKLTDELVQLRLVLVHKFGASDKSFSEFLSDVIRLMNDGSPAASRASKAWQSRWVERRHLLSRSAEKLKTLERLAQIFDDADRSLVFTLSIESANDVAKMLNRKGIRCGVHSSEMSIDARNEMIDAFANGTLKVIATVFTLEEGVDIPEADLAVIIGTTQQRRAIIQRLGRILRVKSDKRFARFVYMYVNGTTEDPNNGAHETVLSELIEVSVESAVFSLPGPISPIRQFLKPKRRASVSTADTKMHGFTVQSE
jgi:superfamily II DNA or RNA helicase